MKVYLDNGATTKVAKEVVEAMLPYFTEKYGNASSLHEKGQEAKEALEESRKTIAGKINAEPEEIIFTSGATESDNMAIKGIARAYKNKGNHIITTKIEHHAVEEPCKALEKEGFKTTYLEVDNEGFVNMEQLRKEITPKTVLVSIIAANNEIGTIQDLEAIGKICKEKNVLFHTDAVQAFTKTPIDVKEMNLAAVSLSAHKINGPKGAGALYIRKEVKAEPLFHGGPHEFNKRAGTENIPGIVGFAKAATLLKEEEIKRMEKSRDYFIKELEKRIPDTKVNGSRTKRLCNNISISFARIEGEGLLMKLDAEGIAVSTGSACSSHELKPSHVLLAIGLSPVQAHGTIRFTLSKYTTKEELDCTLEKLEKAVKELRRISPIK